MKSNFKRWNNITGWCVFAVAAVVYLLTMEPSCGMWDCPEFIATSYKLEVGHPPGAPLFMMLARIATLFAPSAYYVPMMVNAMNCIISAFCVLFLFWTVTHLARRIATSKGESLTKQNIFTILGAGVVGALGYAFTDTFWFTAVEGEVYALSSMFTALVVWLMMKWEEQADEPRSVRWIILIAYLMGLSIGVHLLSLLAIPALVFIWYFRKTKEITFKGIALSALAAGGILIFVNNIIIPYTVAVGAWFDLFFVNVLGLPVNTGMVVFAILLFAALGCGVWWTHKAGKKVWNTILLCVTMILVGYSSYASVTIRAAANPPMNSNNPDNPFALVSFLNREQYGDRPLLYGPQYSAPALEYTYKTVRYVDDGKYKKVKMIDGYKYPSRFMHLFPRMGYYGAGEEAYKSWSAYRTKLDYVRDDEGRIVRDANGRPERAEVLDFGRRVVYDDHSGYEPLVITEPTGLENLNFFFTYQLNHMFWRYFLWNFVGRQNDSQPSESMLTEGNWMSGVKWLDGKYLGPQDNMPDDMRDDPTRAVYFFLPFLLGLVGLIYQLNRDPRNFTVVMWLFLMMGLILMIYNNTPPNEPRERDYIYAGAFYAFSIWMGLGVMAFRKWWPVCLCVPVLLAVQNWESHDRSGRTMSRDVGYNYLQSCLPNAIIINYGDNDTFPLWFNQEVDGVRTDIRIMNSSYLGGEWYIDEMKTRANEAPGVPFSLPRDKYTFTNDVIPIIKRVDRTVDLREAIEFIRSNDPRTQIDRGDGRMVDYLPTNRFSLPVDKDNAIASGIVREKDRDLMVDTIHIELPERSIDKSELMMLDLLAHFDWKRPLQFTQPAILQPLGLMDYLQFDGYAYRLVPIHTPYRSSREIGRIDTDYVAPLLLETFRYGNLNDPRVHIDYFTAYNLRATKVREAFARVARQCLVEGDTVRAVRLLDTGLERLPVSKIRYTHTNTTPYIETYYEAGEWEKGDALLTSYADNLMQYIDYYLQFDGIQGDMITTTIFGKMDELDSLYILATYFKRSGILNHLNTYYRSLGLSEEDLA